MKTFTQFINEKAKIIGKVKITHFDPPPSRKGNSGGSGGNCDSSKFISKQQLNDLEKVLDKLFAHYKVDINFTRHFFDRVNNCRNKDQITIAELQKMFRAVHSRYGDKFMSMKDREAVLVDMQSKINVPFVIKTTKDGVDLVAKTVMRKPDFKTKDRKLKV